MKFELNQRGIEQMMRGPVHGALKDEGTRAQKLLDDLGRRYRGRSVATIKPILKREWERGGGHIFDPELTEFSEAISQGRHIKVNVR